ncbi:putative fibropellin-3 isoform X2 [Apostichopus japonicus]|uniref:Putative fibropellin-3 isoform X2 n=1 Tax=Stichopus japonicus TaxID=307972 RepID=A0A2G8JH03_STIJA|nr:putative fibropellin-3 isoform X2 [Apostichopus japonicus]
MGNSLRKTNALTSQTHLDSRKGQPPNIGGKWYNELGSEVELTVDTEGIITGDYYTAVESEPGAKGSQPAHVIGHVSHNGAHDTFGFNVLWKNGASTTSWAGEYKDCNEEPVLFTTWLLTSETDSCLDNWMSTRIGKDCFTRFRQVPLPGKELTEEERSRNNPCAGGESWNYRNQHYDKK